MAAAVAVGAEQAVEADLARRAQRRGDMAVRQAASDGEGILLSGDHGAALEHAAQAFDMAGDQPERLHSVRLRTLPAWRKLSRSRMAGGEFRFGTASIYIAGLESIRPRGTSHKRVITWLRFETVRSSFPGLPPICSNGKKE